MESTPNSNPIKIPDSIQIYNAFNQFLIQWTNQATRYVSMPMEDMSSLPLEQSVLFSQPFEGLLVIRSTKLYEKFLVELALGRKPGRNFHKQGLFLEMAVLFWHRMALQIWRLDTRTLPPALLRRSVPADWPDRNPNSICTVFIKDFPLEIRLWSDLSPEETKAWKESSHTL